MAGSLSDLLIARDSGTAVQGPDIAGSLVQGVQAGVQLATAKEQVEQKKAQTEAMKADLVIKQASTANSLLTNLARANPMIAKKMLPQVREKLLNLGVSPDVADYTISDDAMRQRQIAFSQQASGKLLSNPESAGRMMAAMADVIGWDQAGQAYDNALKMKQQDKQFAIQEKRIAASEAAANKRLDKQEERTESAYVEKLSKRLTDDAIPEVLNSIQNIDTEVGGLYNPEAEAKFDEIAGKSGLIAGLRIPMTQIAPLENSAIDDEDMALYQSVASLRNAYLKLRSGGAVTDPEANRFLQEMGQGSIRSGKQLQTGIQHLNEAVKKGVKNVEAGYSPSVVERYKAQGAVVTSDSFPSAKGAVSKSPDPYAAQRAKALAAGYSAQEVEDYISGLKAKSAKASK